MNNYAFTVEDCDPSLFFVCNLKTFNLNIYIKHKKGGGDREREKVHKHTKQNMIINSS